jgi:glutaredoxin
MPESSAHHPNTAVIYRMVMPGHICPFGIKALHLLKRKGFQVEDRWIETRAQQEAFKAEHGVKTTPQIFIGGTRVGGHDDLRRYLGLKVKDPSATSYTPVVAVFCVAALIALAINALTSAPLLSILTMERFISVTMILLAMLKLQDVDRFATMFLGYDLLARRWVPYAYAYPFAQLAAGVLMLAGALPWLSVPIAAVIGGIGAVSIYKAVYVEKRSLKCACVGGGTNVPLGFVSLTEDIFMVAMAVWMGLAAWALPATQSM